MSGKRNTWLAVAKLVTVVLCAAGAVAARGSQSGQGSQSQPQAQPGDKSKTPDVTPLTLDMAAKIQVAVMAMKNGLPSKLYWH